MVKIETKKTQIAEEPTFILLVDGQVKDEKIDSLKEAVKKAKGLVKSGIATEIEVGRVFKVLSAVE